MSEGLGVRVRCLGLGCIFMDEIVLPAKRCGKSSRGIPRLRRPTLICRALCALHCLPGSLESCVDS